MHVNNVLLALALLLPATGPKSDEPTVALPAPQAGFRAWLAGSAPKRQRVDAFRGEVLIIHSFAWNCSSCLKVGVPLAVDLQRVAATRGLNVISVTTPAEPGETKRVAAKYGLSNPIALENPFTNKNPYVDISKYPITYFFVIGRNGELVWHGNPSTKLDECLDAIGRALDSPSDLVLERELHTELDEAVVNWFGGDHARSKKLALKLASKHGRRSKGDSPRIASDAQWLSERVDGLAQELFAQMELALVERDALAFVRAHERLTEGFKKHEQLERANQLANDMTDPDFAAELELAATWRELQRERPVLLATRRERREQRWAQSLGRFLKKFDDSPWHAQGRTQLASWKDAD
jgi:hypothetical protein